MTTRKIISLSGDRGEALERIRRIIKAETGHMPDYQVTAHVVLASFHAALEQGVSIIDLMQGFRRGGMTDWYYDYITRQDKKA